MTAATGGAGSPALLIEGLVKRYGRHDAVRGIDLEVQRGEVFGFLGPNGAGKTTTIRCLVGHLRPTAGRIQALGLDSERDGIALRRRLAYVPGELRLPERLTAAQFVAGIGRLRGGTDVRRRNDVAERLRLELDRPIRDLSTGNRRKVALLLAFIEPVDLLVLDEPTSGLDPLMQHEFLAMVREASHAGTTVFLSSHLLSEVQRAADRAAVLNAGRIVSLGTVDELRGRARQRVEIWFDGPVPARELAELADISEPTTDGNRYSATLTGPVSPLIGLLARHRVASLRIEEPDLDEAFLDLYKRAA